MAVDENYGKVVDESFTADEYGRVRINVVGVYQVNLMLMDHERVVSDDAVEIWLPGKLVDAVKESRVFDDWLVSCYSAVIICRRTLRCP